MRFSLAILALALITIGACSTESNADPTLEPTNTAISFTPTPSFTATAVPTGEPSATPKVLQLTGISVDDRLNSSGDVEALLVTCVVRNPTSVQVTEEVTVQVKFVQFQDQSRNVTVDPEIVERVEFSFVPPPNYDFSDGVVNVECG